MKILMCSLGGTFREVGIRQARRLRRKRWVRWPGKVRR